jgi:SAM-dependent methyltransferase
MTKNRNIINQNNTVQYDDFGDTFGKSRQNLHWIEIDEALSTLSAHFHPTTWALADIGCGNGRLLKHIQKHKKSAFFRENFSKYIWLDTSWVLLNQAQGDTELCNFFTLTDWIQGDMRDMTQKIEKYGLFDWIFFIASFHHLMTRSGRISVLHQAKKLLSKTGKILMINWNLMDPSQTKYQSWKIADYPDGSADFEVKIGAHKRFYHAFSHDEYISLAEETKLSVSDMFWERNSLVIWS